MILFFSYLIVNMKMFKVCQYYFTSVLFIILFFHQGCNNNPAKTETTEQLQYFENGAIQRRIEMKNGKKNGKMTDYFPDGKLMGERMFADDKQVGRTVIYFPSGKVKEVQYYNNGLQQGGDTLWYEDRKLEFVTNFDQNSKNGYLRKWGTDSRLIFEARYKHDTLVEVNGRPMIKGRGTGLQ